MRNLIFLCLGFTVAFAAVIPDEPCMCTLELKPVCGSDGKTYSNKCTMECEKTVTLEHEGECGKPEKLCACPLIFRPVCGQDGNTYPSECDMKCEGVSKRSDGTCASNGQLAPEEDPAPPCMCTMIYRPVCSMSGRTYGNRCMLDCDNSAVFSHSGSCSTTTTESSLMADAQAPSACACPFTSFPVCGQDGETYANECVMRCSNVEKASDGECSKTGSQSVANPDPCICTMEYIPVCGADGKTYGNKCNLNCAGVPLAHYSECDSSGNMVKIVPAEQPKPCHCQFKLDPKCGVDGKTYDNECEMNCKGVQKNHDGACAVAE